MYAYLSTAHQLLRSFQAYEIKQIPRGENSHADALARLASAINDKVGRKVPVEILAQPSTVTSEACAVRYEDTWMSPIYSYLTNGTLPEDKAQARKLRYRSARYTVINDVLYKHGYTTPYLKCLTAEQGEYILREIHSGVCGDHSGSRSLAYKAFRQGYFWPTMHQDANSLVKRCDKCQRFGNVPHIPAEPLTPIVSPWPFAQWGLDLIGPMPQGKGQVKYAVVAVDYTKWVEAEPLATITAAKIEDFVWTHICCRFGIPYAIITDNGRQFDSELFRQFCTRLKINLFFASPAHPQSNGQVEAINKIVKKLLKRQLDKAKGAWPEKLPEALWAIRTSYRTSTGETPFSLAFGSEAVIVYQQKELNQVQPHDNGALYSYYPSHLQPSKPPQASDHKPYHQHHIQTLTPSQTNLTLTQTYQASLSYVLHPLAFGLLLRRATTSEETPGGGNPYAGEERDSVISLEDVPPPENNFYNRTWTEEAPKEDSTVDGVDGQTQISEFFNNLDIKLDSDDTYSVLIYGGGALFALWLASAVVGAIDSIPLFPKLLEVVGLGYTIWFSTRYLIFKENREELFAKIQVLKQQVLGSDDD
ncbi:hypothetical protein L3X38_033838 [Prunus dulcis]|uniref:Integrase catalytic domain-containing protein n=1 Tax=Prunus dulcis TaxID=3755 RepID=A0AAD4VGP1_PRUDU|nr:hypothetical protein L3X38_033838 [Prunus dulcis]